MILKFVFREREKNYEKRTTVQIVNSHKISNIFYSSKLQLYIYIIQNQLSIELFFIVNFRRQTMTLVICQA